MRRIVAYRERDSHDPITGEPGILRDEWAVREIGSLPDDEVVMTRQFGCDWRKYRPFAGWVLEHRYIRRGEAEDWIPFSIANSRGMSLADIDAKAVSLDAELTTLQEKTRAEEDHKKEEENRKREEAERENRKRNLEADSQECFRRMLRGSDRNRKIAKRYNEVAGVIKDDNYRSDDKLRELYDAVYQATKVPQKAKFMRAFLAYAEAHYPCK